MLKRHSQFLQSLLFLFDLALICACWMAAYFIRFLAGWGPIEKGVPPLELYISLLVPILFVWGVSFRAFDLYRPRRMGTHFAEFLDIAKANTLAVLILVALTFFIRQFEYSRLFFERGDLISVMSWSSVLVSLASGLCAR